MQSATFTFNATDGPEIFVYKWAPAEGMKPKAAVQVVHGAAGHGLRYERFARCLTEAGYGSTPTTTGATARWPGPSTKRA